MWCIAQSENISQHKSFSVCQCEYHPWNRIPLMQSSYAVNQSSFLDLNMVIRQLQISDEWLKPLWCETFLHFQLRKTVQTGQSQQASSRVSTIKRSIEVNWVLLLKHLGQQSKGLYNDRNTVYKLRQIQLIQWEKYSWYDKRNTFAPSMQTAWLQRSTGRSKPNWKSNS